MLKITVISATQAKTYYAKDDYYTQQEQRQDESYWLGKGSQSLGLTGGIDKAEFQALLDGHTLQGHHLHAKKINPNQHRAGYDCTFSADKSVSFAALVLGDQRVVQAHDQAIATAIQVLEERYAQARTWNQAVKIQETIATGNVIAGIFRHETNRNLDPQLHSHAVLLNATQLKDGTWRALHADGIFAQKKLLQTIYHNELAYQLRQHGYQVEVGKAGSCQIQGYDEALLNSFSSRRRQIERYVEMQVAAGAERKGELYQQAAIQTRQRKQDTPHYDLLERWQATVTKAGRALPEIPESRPIEPANLGQLAYNAIAHAAERASVFERSQVEQFALERDLGQCSFAELQQAINHTNELVKADPHENKYTTQTAISRELDTLRFMEQGKGTQPAISTLDRIIELRPDNLTEGQSQGIELLLTTTDRIVGWQGVAGAGKTYALALGVQEAEATGYTVRCFAPSAEGAKVLGDEVGTQAQTVASLLVSNPEPTAQPQLWIVDEAGLLGAKDAHALLQQAEQQNARVVLVGDIKQLSAIAAGNPFKALQAAGMATAYLEESLRQKNAVLKQAVTQIAQGNIGTGYTTLERARLIHQSDHVANQAAQHYLALTPKQREQTLVIAGTNATRSETAALMREGLKAEGRLGNDRFTAVSLRSRDLTVAQAQYVTHYAPGDVIVPSQNYKRQGLGKYQQYEVLEIQADTNTLMVQGSTGERLTIDPSRCNQITVYQPQALPLAINEQLRWTRNDRLAGRRNGQPFRLLEVDEFGNATIQYQDNTTEQTTLTGKQFADYSLVSTVYSSQGKTADRVIAVADGRISQEAFYVVASRAKHELDIYCTDRARFAAKVQDSQANENVSDYLDLFTYQTGNHATHQVRKEPQTNQRADQSAKRDGRDGGERLGASVGRQLAATLSDDRPDAATIELAGGNSAQIDYCLGELGRTAPDAGIDSEAIAQAVASFVEWREVGGNGSAIANALESINHSIQQLADLCRAVAERDRGQKPERSAPLEASPRPLESASTPAAVPLAEELPSLTPQRWSQLTPRQQISLFQAAQEYQRKEPRVSVQVEQWVGQTAQLQRKFKGLSDRYGKEKAAFQGLESRGQRSLLNPFGVGAEQLSDARDSLRATKQEWKQTQKELAQIQERQSRRQEQELAHRQWEGLPDTQGAQRVLELLKDRELRAQYEAVKQNVGQLRQWQELAESGGYDAAEVETIRQVRQGYLDGQQFPEVIWERMRQDLQRYERSQRQRSNQLGL